MQDVRDCHLLLHRKWVVVRKLHLVYVNSGRIPAVIPVFMYCLKMDVGSLQVLQTGSPLEPIKLVVVSIKLSSYTRTVATILPLFAAPRTCSSYLVI